MVSLKSWFLKTKLLPTEATLMLSLWSPVSGKGKEGIETVTNTEPVRFSASMREVISKVIQSV